MKCTKSHQLKRTLVLILLKEILKVETRKLDLTIGDFLEISLTGMGKF